MLLDVAIWRLFGNRSNLKKWPKRVPEVKIISKMTWKAQQGFIQGSGVLSEVVSILFGASVANMTKATYQKMRKLCSGLFSRKQTLQFVPGDDPEL